MKDNYEYQYYCQPWFYVIYIKTRIILLQAFFMKELLL